MIDSILALVPIYGLYVVGLATFLSCLALPIPSSLIMLTAGAFVASDDLNGPLVAGVAWGGAVAGDQLGYAIGRSGAPVVGRLRGRPAQLVQEARTLSDRHGGWAVFLSRWLLSPLGPYMNLVAGAGRMNWLRFTLWDMAGEAVWVALYLGLGFAFGGQIEVIADIAGNASGFLAAAAVTAVIGVRLRARLRVPGRRSRQGGEVSGQ